ncbi:MAG: DUF1007 family protein [Candidatus Cloacimonetes bacterium]|nr:DUF1007 family protein [Candidatus Cloacimonadota bacterium]
MAIAESEQKKFMDFNKLKTILFLVVFLITLGLTAHPHVFIGVVSKFVFSENELIKLHMHWVFDDMTSYIMLEDFDSNGDEKFNDKEVKNALSIFNEMQGEFNYYTQLTINDSSVVISEIKNFKISFEGISIAYDFDIMLNIPIDSSAFDMKLNIFDEENYVKVMLPDKKAFSFSVPDNIEIETKRYFNMEKSYYYGQLNPEEFSVTFRKK